MIPAWLRAPAVPAGVVYVALAVGAVLLWPAPHLESLRPPNELVRLYSTRAIVDDHTLHIEGPWARYGPIADRAKRDGVLYSDKAPGLSLLAVPLYAAARIVWDADELTNRGLIWGLRVVLIVLPTIAWVAVLGAWLCTLGIDRRLAYVGQIAYALATPAFPYCMELVGHQASAWMLGLALAAAWRGRSGSAPASAGAGFLAGLSAITEYPTAPMLAVVAALAIVGGSRPLRGAFWFALGAVAPLAMGAGYHTLAFGGPLTTGYSFIVNPSFRSVHESGVMGVSLPDPGVVWALLAGSQRGLLPLAPWLALAPLGLVALRDRARRPLALALVLNVLLAWWVASGFGYWLGGWSVGPRHVVSALPAMSLLALFGWEAVARRWPRVEVVLAGALCASGVACTAAAVTYPGFPEELTHPLFELSLPLLARGQFSFSVGHALGASSSVGMIPAVAGAGVLIAWASAGAPLRGERLRGWAIRWGTAGWIALAFFAATAQRATPSPEAIFRVAWLTQTMWAPKDVDHHLDNRLAGWERAKRAASRGGVTPTDQRALGSVAAVRGDADRALAHYARAAWAAPRRPPPDVDP